MNPGSKFEVGQEVWWLENLPSPFDSWRVEYGRVINSGSETVAVLKVGRVPSMSVTVFVAIDEILGSLEESLAVADKKNDAASREFFKGVKR